MRHDWVYIATPSGADLGRTIQLADGSVFSIGLIRRSVVPRRPHLEQLRVGHTMLLTYNLFHSGVVYPIGTFRIQYPEHPTDPHVVPLDSSEYPAIGKLTRPMDRQKLEPDYVSDEASEHVLLGHLLPLEPKEAVKVYRRVAPGDSALNAAGPDAPLREIEETEMRLMLEKALVPPGESSEEALAEAVGSHLRAERLDGRLKQLLVESRLAEHALPAGTKSYALPAFPLCLLAEYVLQRLLAQVARRRLKRGEDLALGSREDAPVLSWIPDPTVYGSAYGFSMCINMLKRLRADELGLQPRALRQMRDALYRIRDFRNRIAHSYSLERKHYRDLQQQALGLLSVLHGPR